jgi:gliding motility-associated-like protein
LQAIVSGGGQPYAYNWSNGATDSTLVDIASSNGSYWINVMDVCGVINTDTSVINVLPSPLLDFYANVVNGCDPLQIQLSVDTSSISGAIYFWEFYEQSATATVSQPTYIYNTAGMYDLSLSVTYGNGCTEKTTKTNYIEVYDSPTAEFTYAPDQITTQEPNCNFNDASQNAYSWEWFIDDSLFSIQQNPSYEFTKGGYYTVAQIVYNNNGCTDTTYKNIEVIEKIVIYFPNAFSPNEDGINDTFIPVVTGVLDEGYSFSIFDRWGEQVYTTTAIGNGWNGKINEIETMMGVYSYQLHVKDWQNKAYVFNGMATLIK